jgi:hypothetical protein
MFASARTKCPYRKFLGLFLRHRGAPERSVLARLESKRLRASAVAAPNLAALSEGLLAEIECWRMMTVLKRCSE